MLGLFIINSKKLANDFKENIAMTVFFKNEAKDSVVKAFETQIKVSPFVKSYKYVTKEAAAKETHRYYWRKLHDVSWRKSIAKLL